MTHYVYVLAMDQLMTFTTQPASETKGALRLGKRVRERETARRPRRTLRCDRHGNRKVAWTKMTPQPLIGGALATAGNLVFMGEGDGDFDAFDAKSGDELWHYNLGAGVNAPRSRTRSEASSTSR